jgi:hypothetical protein
MGIRPGEGGSGKAVVVLGYRNVGSRANLVNRWRVRTGLRSQQPELGPSLLVFCGASGAGTTTEAELMASYARDSLGYTGELLTETTSRTTWENVQNAIPLIGRADRIKIVSQPTLHAERARLYLWRNRPDLADRLVPAADYRFGEWLPLKPALAAYSLPRLRRAARNAPVHR